MTQPARPRQKHSRRTATQQRALMRAHTTLSWGIQNVLDEGGKVPCIAAPRVFQEPAKGPKTKEEREQREQQIQACRALCRTCPVLDVCLVYAQACREQHVSVGAFLPVASLVAA